jgi:outer membrane lipoprotein-sorting protein
MAVCVILLIFCFCTGSTAQTTASTVLTQMASATGWNKHTVPNDVIATGTVTRLSRPSPDTVDIVVKSKGQRLFRLEVQNGSYVTIVKDDQVVAQNPTGARLLPISAAISIQPFVFPFYSDLADFQDPHVVLQYASLDTVNGRAAYRVEVIRQPDASDANAARHRQVQRTTVWISADTFLPLQIATPAVAEDNPSSVATRYIRFSDYRNVGGLQVPFRQEEFVNSSPVSIIQLSDVRFNVGLSAADFSFPAVQ